MVNLIKFFQKTTWVKIAVPIIASVALFSASVIFIHLPNVFDSLLEQKKENLKSINQIAMRVVQFYYEKQQQGLLTQEEAQKQALQNIAMIRYGPESRDYLWVNDFHPTMVMHPYVTDLNGKDLSDYADPTGKKLFVEMVRASEKTGSAFVSYRWQWKDKAHLIYDKVSYVKRFKPWSWIIGSGVYLNDIEIEAEKQAQYILVTSMVVLALLILLSAFSIWQGKVATRKIRDSEATLRGIFEQTAEYMCILSLNGEIRSVNNTTLSLSGDALEDVLGRPLWDIPWWREQRPDIRELVHDSVLKARNGGLSRIEANFTSHDGKKIVLDVFIQPIKDESGNPVFIFVDGVDITDRKRSQEELEERVKERTLELELALEKLKATQNHLVQAEKMAALGGLVAGVAHEINTPLGLGVTNTSFLLEQVRKIKKSYEGGSFTKGEFEKFLERAEEIGRSLDINLRRGASIIRSFKQVAVDQEVEDRRIFEVREYLEEVLTSLNPRYKRTKHSVEIDCPDDIKLDTYPGVLMQVISNLIMNSLIHGFEGVESGNIRIQVSQQDDKAIVEYTDDGIGMTPEQKSKVYDPFFTTRQGKGGTGLGMHIVFNLVTQKLCGNINLETSPGKGVRYVITLPLKHPGETCEAGDVINV